LEGANMNACESAQVELASLLETREEDPLRWLEWKERMISGMKSSVANERINLDAVIKPVIESLFAKYPNVDIYTAAGHRTAQHLKGTMECLVALK